MVDATGVIFMPEQVEIDNSTSAIRVGDLIQYRYRWREFGVPDHALSTRAVEEVVNGGASFIVQGGFRVEAAQITAHIPMHSEAVNSEESTVDSQSQNREQ